ncbi:MAG: FAD-dependent oxidoreductase [Burkholderiaceae bacterium]
MTNPNGSRHAEIAGAGFAGLTAAIALAQRGWSVRVHDRRSMSRSEGYGITLQGNGYKVLKALGLEDAIGRLGMPVIRQERYDQHGRCIASIPVRSTFRISRYAIVQEMVERARALGVQVLLDSPVAGAAADGQLILEDGRRLRADLVIGADGYRSPVREALGLLKSHRKLRDCGARTVIQRRPEDPPFDVKLGGVSREYWSGSRRLLITPCSPGEMYFTMSCLSSDTEARRIPIDPSVWKRSFPHLAGMIDRCVAEAEWDKVMFVEFELIRLSRWYAGKVAILGDAANAMPPNLGQGAGIAMLNAWALAAHLDEHANAADALAAWEAAERPLTEHTQRWSSMYSATTHWPDFMRALAMGATARIGWLRRRYQRTALTSPRGLAD